VQRALTKVEEIFREVLPGRIPGYEVREQQIEMARLVERGLLHEQHVLAEAGTGTGKSFAYLIPLSQAIGDDQRAVVSTATIALQEQLLSKDIPFLEDALGIEFRAELAKGKGNYICLLRYQEEIQNQGLFPDDELEKLKNWVEETTTGDRAELPFEPGESWSRVCADDTCLGRKCLFYESCFLAKARKRLHSARLIICNHALFFTDLNLRYASGGSVSLLPEYRYLVFDEAQHLEDTARRTMSTEVSNMRLQVLLNQLRKREGCHLDAVNKALSLNSSFFDAVGRLENSGCYTLSPTPEIMQLGEELQEAVKNTITMFAVDLVGERENALFKCLERYNHDLEEILEASDQDKVYWVEKSEHRKRKFITLHATPLDVATTLEHLLFTNDELGCVVMTSATLSINGDFSFIKGKIGCSHALEISVESPFFYEDQCLLYLPSDLPDPREADFYPKAAQLIAEILKRTQGRAFVLFTSYKGLNQVYDLLKGQLPWRLLKQGDLPKNRLIKEFKEDISSVLFATASYWEGVDVPGEALSCVILVKLPFAVPDDPLTEAKIRAIERSGGNSFYSYSLPEAVIRLRQGFGRLIRTQQDQGVVAILDPRIKTRSYGRYFLEALPPCREISNIDEIEQFLGK